MSPRARLTTIFFFFFNDTATPAIYTLSLHDALPICGRPDDLPVDDAGQVLADRVADPRAPGDRKSTRLNSSHVKISYAGFSLKKTKMPHHVNLRTCLLLEPLIMMTLVLML